jgi:membrane protein DedA with SNARE-associated domain
MDLLEFVVFTLFGAGLWALVLTLLGYYIGENQVLIEAYLKEITVGVIIVLVVIVAIYYRYQKNKKQ